MNDETSQTEPDGPDGSTRTEPDADAGTTTTDPPPPLPPAQRPRPVRRLRRAPDAPLGGVATGIANYFDITPLVIQVAFVATTALSGFGALAYVACWFLIPTPSDPETRPVTITSDTTRAVLGVLFAIAAASVTFTLGPNTFEITLLPILLVAAGFYLLNQRNEQTRPVANVAPDATIGSADETTDAMWADAPASAPWATIDPDVDSSPPEPPGPPVTSVTLAVAAVAVGLLLTIGQFGPAVSSAAVFGTALAILGGGLVYGAFRGRPRGLVPLGLLLVIGLALAPAFDAFASGGTGPREYSPIDEADVLDIYDLGAGPMELDLRRVEFTEDRTIEVNVGAGYAEIWLPSDVNVRVDAEVTAGYLELFGRENAGIRSDATASRSGEPGSPTITLDADVTFGYVEVRRG